ncbi:MAG: aminotransferase class I/II-fold pyridoxal phosphate-dependent enzyme [Planctomycetes bacterium]|nr:aminotransferase class I/II-fold pyridoxal phosphate-dependent enzyme [Planctomycetota bacterium]
MSSRQPSKRPEGMSTRSVHGGETRPKAHFALTLPVVHSSTYTFPKTQDLIDYMEGRVQRGEEYGRYGNPTQRAVEAKLAKLEGAEMALLFSSGMAAITTTLLAMVRRDSHLIFTNDCYRKTRQFAASVLQKFEIQYDLVEPEAEAISRAIRPNTQVIFTESPTNPYLNIVDLEKLVKEARPRGIKTVIDSTFATPYNQRPLEFGVDLVIHSATKYLGGHNDLLAGCVAGRHGLVSAIKDLQGILGPVPGPLCSYLLARGLKTFALRMEKQNRNGQLVAEFLERHPKIFRTYYPGLPSHPDHDIACRQMSGFGSVVSFEVRASLEECSRFIDALKIPYIAPSLGGVESLIEQPALMSFYELSREQREAIGIRENLVRFAIGIEDEEDLIGDLRQALEQIP